LQPYHLLEPFLDISLPIAFEDEEEKETFAIAATSKFREEKSEQTTFYVACDIDEHCNAHVEPTATETYPGLSSHKSTAENTSHSLETHSDKAGDILVSESGHLLSLEYLISPTSGGQIENRNTIEDKELGGAEWQEKSAEHKEVQNYLNSSKKRKDESEDGDMRSSEIALDRTVVAAADLQRTTDNNTPLATQTEAEKQSTSAKEPEIFGALHNKQTQTKCSSTEFFEAKADRIPESEITESAQCRVEEIEEFTEYLSAVKKAKERLKTTSEKPNTKNSVLNSFRFYTREEHLDEYFCITCNEGIGCFFTSRVYKCSPLCFLLQISLRVGLNSLKHLHDKSRFLCFCD